MNQLEEKRFSEINIEDSFFDSLKLDYPEFSKWFSKKSDANEEALVVYDKGELGAFMYIKQECEIIKLDKSTLPAKNRLKIGTLKISDKLSGTRLGEGLIGVALLEWQKSTQEEIYVTVFEKHSKLVSMLETFGLSKVDKNDRGECILIKSKHSIPHGVKSAFPYVLWNESTRARLIAIEAQYHDTLFPLSTLKNTSLLARDLNSKNGVSKYYIGKSQGLKKFIQGDLVFTYRKKDSNSNTGSKYASCITSCCLVNSVEVINCNNLTENEFINKLRNKTAYKFDELTKLYHKSGEYILLELLYIKAFSSGNNVNYKYLSDTNLWMKNTYPTDIVWNLDNVKQILQEANQNVQNFIINTP